MNKKQLIYVWLTLLLGILTGCYGDRWNLPTGEEVPLQSIFFKQASVELKKGDTCTLELTFDPSFATNRHLTWLNSDTVVAKVDSLGHVTALRAGETVVTAESDFGHTAECLVKVRGEVTGEIENTQTGEGESTGKIEW